MTQRLSGPRSTLPVKTSHQNDEMPPTLLPESHHDLMRDKPFTQRFLRDKAQEQTTVSNKANLRDSKDQTQNVNECSQRTNTSGTKIILEIR